MDRKLLIVFIIFVMVFIITYPFMPKKDHLVEGAARYILGKTTDVQLDIQHRYSDCEEVPNRQFEDLSDKGRIIFMFDDGWDTQYTEGYRILSEKGYPASIAVVPAMVGRDEYVTLDELREVYDDGWDLVNHTYNHLNLIELSAEEQLEEIEKASKWMQTYCFSKGHDSVIYPFGSYNNDTLQILEEGNYRSARSLIQGYEKEESANTYHVKGRSLLTDTEVTWALDWIDEAIENRETLIFILHKIDDEEDYESQMSFSPSKLEEIVHYVSELDEDKVEVLTYTEWLDYAEQLAEND